MDRSTADAPEGKLPALGPTDACVTTTSAVDWLGVHLSGDVPDERIRRFRLQLEQVRRGGDVPLLLDLSGLRSWGHEAQAALLRAVRDERAKGRRVDVSGLSGDAARQAAASGMGALLRGTRPVAGSPGPRGVTAPAVLAKAVAATLGRAGLDRRGGRSSSVRAICRFGHPAEAGQESCPAGHLVLFR